MIWVRKMSSVREREVEGRGRGVVMKPWERRVEERVVRVGGWYDVIAE